MARSSYKIYNNEYPYFITSTVVEWLDILLRPEIAQIIIDSLKFLICNNRISLYSYVIMSNHLHLILSSNNLSKEISSFKSFTARQIIDLFKNNQEYELLEVLAKSKAQNKKDRNYQFWQEGFHPEEINNQTILRQKMEYIHNNPVKKSYVSDSKDWLLSSARDYEGRLGLLPINMEWY